MATIDTSAKWRDAAAHWVTANRQTITGAVTIIPPDEVDFNPLTGVITDGDNVNITPALPTLEAALDGALTAITTQQAATAIQTNAKAQAAAIPNWSGWSEAQVLQWLDSNITNALPAANLAAANVVLSNMATAQRAMARMIVALRNQVWSDLQGG